MVFIAISAAAASAADGCMLHVISFGNLDRDLENLEFVDADVELEELEIGDADVDKIVDANVALESFFFGS